MFIFTALAVIQLLHVLLGAIRAFTASLLLLYSQFQMFSCYAVFDDLMIPVHHFSDQKTSSVGSQ